MTCRPVLLYCCSDTNGNAYHYEWLSPNKCGFVQNEQSAKLGKPAERAKPVKKNIARIHKPVVHAKDVSKRNVSIKITRGCVTEMVRWIQEHQEELDEAEKARKNNALLAFNRARLKALTSIS